MRRCACAVALLCAAFAYAHAMKRAEMSASPFVLSTRYGRSPPRTMSQRTDRFFLNGRYGKRSDSTFFVPPGSILAERLRDRGRGEFGDILHKWRPRCDCAPYLRRLGLKNIYKRTPEVMDQTVYRD